MAHHKLFLFLFVFFIKFFSLVHLQWYTTPPSWSGIHITKLWANNENVLLYWFKPGPYDSLMINGEIIEKTLFTIPCGIDVIIRATFDHIIRRTTTKYFVCENRYATNNIKLDYDGSLRITGSYQKYLLLYLSCFNDGGLTVYNRLRISLRLPQDFSALKKPGVYACGADLPNYDLTNTYSNILIFTVNGDEGTIINQINPVSVFLIKDVIPYRTNITVEIQIEPLNLQNIGKNYYFVGKLMKQSKCVQLITIYCLLCKVPKVERCSNSQTFALVRWSRLFDETIRNVFTMSFLVDSENTEYKLQWVYNNLNNATIFREIDVWTVGDSNNSLQIQEIGSTYIVFNKTNRDFKQTTFLVTLISADNPAGLSFELAIRRIGQNFSELLPNENYTITWCYKYGAKWIQSDKIYNVVTKPAPPSPPQSVKYHLINNNTVLLEWEKPERSNGLLMGYVVNCVSTNRKTLPLTITSNDTKCTLTIEPTAIYSCGITAKNQAGISLPTVPIHIKHSDVVRPVVTGLSVEDMTDSTLELSWKQAKNQYQQAILAYVVIIGQLPELCTFVYVLDNNNNNATVNISSSVRPYLIPEMADKLCSVKSWSVVPVKTQGDKIWFKINHLNMTMNHYVTSVYTFTSDGLGSETNYPIDFYYPNMGFDETLPNGSTITFSLVYSAFDSEVIFCLRHDGHEIQSQRWKGPYVEFTHLEFNETYEFGWHLLVHERKLKFNSLHNFTNPSFPASSPQNFTIKKIKEKVFQLQWQTPEHMNGHFKGYNVQCFSNEVNRSINVFETFLQMNTSTDAWFECSVMAVNDQGNGQPSNTIGFGKCSKKMTFEWNIMKDSSIKNVLKISGTFPTIELCSNAFGFLIFMMQNSTNISCVKTILGLYQSKVFSMKVINQLIEQAMKKELHHCPQEISFTFDLPESGNSFEFVLNDWNKTEIQNIFFQAFALNEGGLGDMVTFLTKIQSPEEIHRFLFVTIFVSITTIILVFVTIVILFTHVPALARVFQQIRSRYARFS